MDFSALRSKMVDNQIRTTDVTSHSVLNAFLDVERDSFVGDRLKPLAYIDTDLEIAPGRYIMSPSPLAKLLQLAEIDKDCSVLEIGAGNGYVSALLSELSASVVALESDAALADAARANLATRSNVKVVTGSLPAGYAAAAPYDVIFVNGSVETLPDSLFSQLKDGGRLVAVMGTGLSSGARLYIRENGSQSERFAFNASVRPLPGFEAKPEFVF
ncbi:protein-L-isoaspartate O-methyltransferase family protein [Rhizobium alvei]|uniref:Protein-L-isoaspartate O-methyltransferase n=1 Tax=Rhizobium alvei TaxID=1132659 RepID=A0ABT8YK37_9HYPH|nr:protein-L-isoaspartate O-methyltransferase [Rhizobium alvei]MDO6964008.1 protein-L-isoaspartate O-methyltransferase [Rhizobium alvei]